MSVTEHSKRYSEGFWRKISRTLMSPMLCLGLIGCELNSDVSGQTHLWGGYERDKIYRINFDVFLMQNPSLAWFSGEEALVPPSGVKMPSAGKYTAPYSVHFYRTGKHLPNEIGRYPSLSKSHDFGPDQFIVDWTQSKVLGVVEKGTRLRASSVKMKRQWSPFYGFTSIVSVFGEIIDGEFAGLEANLSGLSSMKRVEDYIVFHPVNVVFKDFKLFD